MLDQTMMPFDMPLQVSDPTLLLVDDDKPFLQRMSRALDQRGFLVSTAESIASGLSALEDHAPAHAVVDMRLADGNGLEVVASSPLFGCEREKRSVGPAETGQTHHGVVYPCDKGNWVFNAGTIWWPEGLSCPPGHIPARSAGCAGTSGVFPLAQQVTSNVLDRMIKDSPRG